MCFSCNNKPVLIRNRKRHVDKCRNIVRDIFSNLSVSTGGGLLELSAVINQFYRESIHLQRQVC